MSSPDSRSISASRTSKKSPTGSARPRAAHDNAMKSDRIKNWPREEPPRGRLLAEGADKLTEAERLAVILRVGQGTFKEGVRGQNASDVVRTLLNEYGGLAGLDRAHVRDLLKVPGLGPEKVAQIKAVFRLGKLVCAGKSAAVSFESSQAVGDYFRPRFTGMRQEIVVGVLLNSGPCRNLSSSGV